MVYRQTVLLQVVSHVEGHGVRQAVGAEEDSPPFTLDCHRLLVPINRDASRNINRRLLVLVAQLRQFQHFCVGLLKHLHAGGGKLVHAKVKDELCFIRFARESLIVGLRDIEPLRNAPVILLHRSAQSDRTQNQRQQPVV